MVHFVNWRNDPYTCSTIEAIVSYMCTWKISGVFNGNGNHDLCDASVVLLRTELWSHSYVSRSICWAHLSDSHYAAHHVNNNLISWISSHTLLSNRWCRNCSPLQEVCNSVVRTFSSFLSLPFHTCLNPSCAVFPASLFLWGLKDNSVKNQNFSFMARKQNLPRWDGDIWISREGLIPLILLVYYCKAVLVQPNYGKSIKWYRVSLFYISHLKPHKLLMADLRYFMYPLLQCMRHSPVEYLDFRWLQNNSTRSTSGLDWPWTVYGLSLNYPTTKSLCYRTKWLFKLGTKWPWNEMTMERNNRMLGFISSDFKDRLSIVAPCKTVSRASCCGMIFIWHPQTNGLESAPD